MKKTLLIVAREGQWIGLIKKKLGPLYELHCAENYDAGLNFYCEKAPDAVIIEDFIKTQSGLALSRRIKQENDTVCVILLLHEEVTDRHRAKLITGADYIVPYTKDEHLCGDIMDLPLFQNSQQGIEHSDTAEYAEGVKRCGDAKVSEDEAVFVSI